MEANAGKLFGLKADVHDHHVLPILGGFVCLASPVVFIPLANVTIAWRVWSLCLAEIALGALLTGVGVYLGYKDRERARESGHGALPTGVGVNLGYKDRERASESNPEEDWYLTSMPPPPGLR